jgi:hypothetical protein
MMQIMTQALTAMSNGTGGTSRLDAHSCELPKLASLSNIHDWDANLKDGQAYQVWKTLAKMRLQAKGLYYVLETNPPLSTHPTFSKWQQHNSLVFSVLTEALPTKEQTRFIHLSDYPNSASRVWTSIADLYFRTSQYDYMKLQDELRQFGPKTGENMINYLHRADELHRKFSTYNVPFSEAEFSGQVFRALGTIHNSWLLLHEKLPADPANWNLATIHNLLQSEDNKRRSMIQKDVVPMFPPLGYRHQASARLTFTLDGSPTRLPPIKTKGTPGSTPHHPHVSRSGSTTPRSGTSTPKGGLSPRHRTPPSPSKSTRSSVPKSTAHLLCWKCNQPGHAFYEATKCSQFEDGWKPASADGGGGTSRGSGADSKNWRK